MKRDIKIRQMDRERNARRQIKGIQLAERESIHFVKLYFEERAFNSEVGSFFANDKFA